MHVVLKIVEKSNDDVPTEARTDPGLGTCTPSFVQDIFGWAALMGFLRPDLMFFGNDLRFHHDVLFTPSSKGWMAQFLQFKSAN